MFWSPHASANRSPNLVCTKHAPRGRNSPSTDPHTQTATFSASPTMSAPENEDSPRRTVVIPVDSTESEATKAGRSKKRRKKSEGPRKKRRTDADGSAKPSETQKMRMDWNKFARQSEYLRSLLPEYLRGDSDARKNTRRVATRHIVNNWPGDISAGDWKEVSRGRRSARLKALTRLP